MQRLTRRGFTLVEVVLGMGILGLVLAAAYSMWNVFLGQFTFASAQTESLELAYRTLRTITREVRGLQESEAGAYALVGVGDEELEFYCDTDDDGTIELVRYVLNGTTLIKGVIEPSGDPVEYLTGNETFTIVAEDIANEGRPLFYYYNEDWPEDVVTNPVATAALQLATRYVEVELWIDSNQSLLTQPVRVSTGVTLRKIKTNL